jgi:hypothetical protein
VLCLQIEPLTLNFVRFGRHLVKFPICEAFVIHAGSTCRSACSFKPQ